MKRIVLTATLMLLIFNLIQASSPPLYALQQSSAAAATTLAKLVDDYFEESLRLSPLLATAIADHRFDDQLPVEISREHRAQRKAFYTKYLSAISKLDRNQLSGSDRLSYDILMSRLRMNLEALAFDDHLMPVNQFSGPHLTFAQLGSGASFHPFKTVRDYDNFLQRINGSQAWIETAITNMRAGAKVGFVPPKVLMEKVLPQLQSMIVEDAKQSIFYQPVLKLPSEFSEADRARLSAAYSKAITAQVIPGYRKLHDFIKTEYLPVTRSSSGISALPNGKAWYAHLAKSWTTTDLTPDQIHQIGLSEVRRIRAEMETVKTQVEFKGDLQAFFADMRTTPKFYPFTTEDEVLSSYRQIEARMQPQLAKLFNLVPKAKFEVRATEKFRAATAAAQYSRAAPDGSRPGVFYVPIVDAKKHTTIGMESLFLHEAIPGHHYQIALQQEMSGLPKFRQFGGFGAFTEGWALYTESLGRELGLYRDPYQYLGRLTGEMHRAIRLVVDTGMHAKGWSREDAIKYMLENNARSEAEAVTEIERYMALPGQALSYKIGELKIIELRRKAEKAFGAKFDIRAFHDEVLKDGALPLDVLEAKVTEWISKHQ